MNRLSRLPALVLAAVILFASTANAQHADIVVYSTEENSGALTVTFDFEEKVRVFENICAAGRCLYSNTDPGFIGATQDNPNAGLHALADDTRVSFEVVAISSAVTVRFGDDRLSQPGAVSLIGTAPNLHNHPAWQVLTNQGEVGDFDVSFKLTATQRYAESAVFTLTLTNDPSAGTPAIASPTPTVPTTPTASASPSGTATQIIEPTSTPEATSTPVAESCTGDCDGNLLVTVDEIIAGINIALGRVDVGNCQPFDTNLDGRVTVDEIVSAVRAALQGCV
jgi:hypothetical protein